MTKKWCNRYYQLGVVSSLVIVGAISTSGERVIAQIRPDNTLGAERSQVTSPSPGTFQIDGGATRGTNLFHSFSQFSVPTNGVAAFNNAVRIQNIISRVTGGNVSNIDGLLKANGTANLFLINPNGIIFGRNASLNIGGSFVGSTASSLKFADGSEFSATAPQTTPLLTISVPQGLQFGANPGRILVQGDGQGIQPIDTTVALHVASNQTLAIVGGDVALEGGTLKTAGGRIELGSVAGPSIVTLTPIDKGWALGYEGVPTFGDIKLFGGATVDVSGNGVVGSGDLQVWGKRVTLQDGSRFLAFNLGVEPGGTIAVNAKESFELTGTGAEIYKGILKKILSDVTSPPDPNPNSGTAGPGSSIPDLCCGIIALATFGSRGAAGNVVINTPKFIARNGAFVVASTFGPGRAGEITVNSDYVELSASAFTTTSAGTQDPGDSGNLTINTRQLVMQDLGLVSTSVFGQVQGGNLAINASESVELVGTVPFKFAQQNYLNTNYVNTGLFTSSVSGKSGELQVKSNRLIVRQGADISASTVQGHSGSVTVTALESIKVIGSAPMTQEDSSAIAASAAGITPDSTAQGGDVRIRTKNLIVDSGAEITVSSQGKGNAGNINVLADSISLNNQGRLRATSISGDGGNIKLQAQNILIMRHKSEISTTAGTAPAGGNGGDITINTPLIIAVPSENSKISANAFTGNGGKVKINAQSIFGTQFRAQSTPESDITASSTGGGSNGVVNINTLDINPSLGLVALPVVPVDLTKLIAQECQAFVGPRGSKFIVTGRGGLPDNPSDPLSADAVEVNLVTLNPESKNHSVTSVSTQPTSATPAPLIEATGWVTNDMGQVVLIARAPSVTPDIPWLRSTNCHPQ